MRGMKRLRCRLCSWTTPAEAKVGERIFPDSDAMRRMQMHWAKEHWNDLMIVEAKEEEYYRGREVKS